MGKFKEFLSEGQSELPAPTKNFKLKGFKLLKLADLSAAQSKSLAKLYDDGDLEIEDGNWALLETTLTGVPPQVIVRDTDAFAWWNGKKFATFEQNPTKHDKKIMEGIYNMTAASELQSYGGTNYTYEDYMEGNMEGKPSLSEEEFHDTYGDIDGFTKFLKKNL